LKYGDLKRLARNSLEYSFLAGQSLWQSSKFAGMNTACAADRPGAAAPSQGCTAFLKTSDRARSQWQLEADFAEFEALP
jgi:adenosine deaminase/adenosine deaminase CECR1